MAKKNVLSTVSVCEGFQDHEGSSTSLHTYGICAGEMGDSNHRTNGTLVESLFVDVRHILQARVGY